MINSAGVEQILRSLVIHDKRMSGETEAYEQIGTPYYAQIDKYNGGEQKLEPYETQSEYDRDDNMWHDKLILTTQQKYLETSLYSVIKGEDSMSPVAVVDANRESNSSMYSLLQAEDTSNSFNSLDVKYKSKSSTAECADTVRHRARMNCVFLITTIACFAMLLLLFIVVVIIIFSQISIIKSQYNSLQKNMHDNIQHPETKTPPNVPPATTSWYSNFSNLQNLLLDTSNDLNTLMNSMQFYCPQR